VLRRCVWSRNIKNGCSIYIYNISRLRVKQLVTGLSSSHGKDLGSILASPSVIYGGQKGNGSGFSPWMSLFFVSFHQCCFTHISSVYYQHYIIVATEGTVKQKASLSDWLHTKKFREIFPEYSQDNSDY